VIDATFDFGERGRLVVVRDAAELAREAVDLALTVVISAQAERHWSYAALSGGSTPKAMGEVLSRQPYRDLIAWHYLHVFWGDERSVPLKSSESNAGEAKRIFLDQVPIPASQVHVYETDDPAVSIDQAAADYQATIRKLVPSENGTPRFDLIFLGMGDDGHTASLFPGTAPIHNTTDLVVSHFVPKLNTNRITFTPRLLNAAREIVFLVGGAGKATKLKEVLEGPVNVDELPSQVIRPTPGNLTWLVDRAAAAELSIAGELPRG
jgi:6-phosphogluconolactonase